MKQRQSYRLTAIGLALVALVSLAACAGTRHVAVVADATFANAVFALDDAEFTACQMKRLTEAQCAALNPVIKRALEHVKAVTAALQATPKDGALPKDLPDLLQDLSDVRAALQPLAAVDGALGDLAAKAGIANNRAIALLKTLAGGN